MSCEGCWANSQRGGGGAPYVWAAAGLRGWWLNTGVAMPLWRCVSCRGDPDDNIKDDSHGRVTPAENVGHVESKVRSPTGAIIPDILMCNIYLYLIFTCYSL